MGRSYGAAGTVTAELYQRNGVFTAVAQLTVLVQVVIHHFDEPRWEIANHESPSRTVHLSHHNGEQPVLFSRRD